MQRKAHFPKKKKKPFVSYTKFALTEIDYKKLVQACNKKEDQILIQLAVELGLRRLDISKILISNIKISENREQASRITYHEHKKNRDRTIALPDALAQEIGMYLQTLPPDQKYLFRWGKSKFGDFTAYRRFNDLCVRAGIQERPFHALRGSAYKFKKAQGWSVEQAAALLGDSIDVAMKHYGTPSDAEIDELMRGGHGVEIK
ncbi:MAG: site-specific integrase [Thermoplasmata archaeon]|nr:site-specific integrase [Thermoplasmata archaeon]